MSFMIYWEIKKYIVQFFGKTLIIFFMKFWWKLSFSGKFIPLFWKIIIKKLVPIQKRHAIHSLSNFDNSGFLIVLFKKN